MAAITTCIFCKRAVFLRSFATVLWCQIVRSICLLQCLQDQALAALEPFHNLRDWILKTSSCCFGCLAYHTLSPHSGMGAVLGKNLKPSSSHPIAFAVKKSHQQVSHTKLVSASQPHIDIFPWLSGSLGSHDHVHGPNWSADSAFGCHKPRERKKTTFEKIRILPHRILPHFTLQVYTYSHSQYRIRYDHVL